jgi:DNA (cytosine-5)-methyltransferase 1
VKPRLLDLFCGPGFAARGYALAGWEVFGVDIEPQPLYPCAFVEEGALGYLERLLWRRAKGEPIPFEGIHASPPCFKFSPITAVSGAPGDELDLVTPTRSLLEQTGLPWVIENVPRSPLRQPYVICGASMACRTVDDRYRLKRHRHFETSFPMIVPPCACAGDPREVLGVYGGGTSQPTRVRANPNGGNTNKANTQQARELYGIDEPLPRSAMNLGFPPRYTELIGYQLLQHLKAVAA